jgi:hypothetical protein
MPLHEENNKTHFQNPDKKLFPENLKIVGHIPEKKFAVPIWNGGLPEGLCFVNLSDNYTTEGISQTETYKKLRSKFVPIEEVGVSADEYEFENSDIEPEELELDDRSVPETPEVSVYMIQTDGAVLFHTPDKNPWVKETDHEICDSIEEVEFHFCFKHIPKRRIPLCRRN